MADTRADIQAETQADREDIKKGGDSDQKSGIGIQKRKKRLRKKRTLRRLEPRVMLDAAAVATAAEITENTPEPEKTGQTPPNEESSGKTNGSSGLFDDPEAAPGFFSREC